MEVDLDQGAYSQIELDWFGLIDVRYAPIATNSTAQQNDAMCQERTKSNWTMR